MTARLIAPLPAVVQAAHHLQLAAAMADSRAMRRGAAVTMILGGAAAGLHLPLGPDFVQVARGSILAAAGPLGHARFMAGVAPLDLRSWLSDLLDFGFFQLGGAVGLVLLGSLLGGVLGIGLARALRNVHPLAAIVAGGLALLALSQVLTSSSALWLALLSLLLLLSLDAVGSGARAAPLVVLALTALWANLEQSAVLVPGLLLLWTLAARSDRRRGSSSAAPPWWLVPAALLATWVNPAGPWLWQHLPLALGMAGEHPLFALWSSPDFHPWGARLAELAALTLLGGYLLAGSRLRRGDAVLGLTAALLALLFAYYIPLFLVVVAVQAPRYLSLWVREQASGAAPGPRRWGWSAAAAPVMVAVLLLGLGSVVLARDGGPTKGVDRALPVAAASWLAKNHDRGVWYTTPSFGDYLAARFPEGGHLVCTSDAVAVGSAGLGRCDELAVLNQGAMAVLRRTGARLAILPRTAPQVAFLSSEGWRTRYVDTTTVVLAPPRNP